MNMQYIHIWQVKATLESTKTTATYDVDSKVITKNKSFSEAEAAGLEFVNKYIDEHRNHCTFDGLDEINYVGLGGTLIINS